MKLLNIKKIKLATCIAVFCMAGQASAAWEPNGPIKLQVGFGAGGSTDSLSRTIASSIEENTGWDVIVENKPGGGGIAMFSSLVHAKPNGLKMGIGVTIPTLLNLALRGDKLPFKVDSFDYLATIALAPLALVAPFDAPYNSVEEFIAYSKAKKGGALIGFDAGPQRMIMLSINKQSDAGFEMVSHKSGSEIIQGLLGGQLQAGFGAGAHIQYLKSGDLKMLAVATKARHAYAPNTASFIDQGYPYSIEPYFYIAAPKGLSVEAKETLAKVLDDAINAESTKIQIQNLIQTVPTNLGAAGTLEKLVSGLPEIKKLIDSAK